MDPKEYLICDVSINNSISWVGEQRVENGRGKVKRKKVGQAQEEKERWMRHNSLVDTCLF